MNLENIKEMDIKSASWKAIVWFTVIAMITSPVFMYIVI